MFTIKRGTHTSRGDNPPFYGQSYAPFSTLNFLNAATAERWNPHAVLLLLPLFVEVVVEEEEV